jgi:acetylornithine deacetylase/succinyl-diaminopimelate desuccinylase-like protein
MHGTDKKSLLAFAARERTLFERTLQEFIEIPTVSSDLARQRDIRRCADLAAQTIRDFGGEPAIVETGGNPIVHGRFDSRPDAPTVTVYNHLDVQPASRDTEPWDSDPFTFTKEGDRYLRPRHHDDKGPCADRAVGISRRARGGASAQHARAVELEEETVSPNSKPRWPSTNAGWQPTPSSCPGHHLVARNRPACPAGLRGLAGFELVLKTGETDQHPAPPAAPARNPIGELMQLVSEMYARRAHRQGEGSRASTDDVELPTKRELDEFRSSGFSVKKPFKADHMFKSIRTEDAVRS